jgi:hypothetical protein
MGERILRPSLPFAPREGITQAEVSELVTRQRSIVVEPSIIPIHDYHQFIRYYDASYPMESLGGGTPPQPPPVFIERLNPNPTLVGRSETIIATGWGFDPGSIINHGCVGDMLGGTSGVNSPTEMFFVSETWWPAGSWSIYVKSPLGNSPIYVHQINSTLGLQDVSPPAPTGVATLVTCTGFGFGPGCILRRNNESIQRAWVDDTQVTFTTDPSWPAGEAWIRIDNSNSVRHEITAAP